MLTNGKVLVNGGYSGSPLHNTELYDASTGVWTNTGYINYERGYHAASVLTNGKVLVTGGSSFNAYLTSSELYQP
jgi:N-acetylneuraminic acid mutarotase